MQISPLKGSHLVHQWFDGISIVVTADRNRLWSMKFGIHLTP